MHEHNMKLKEHLRLEHTGIRVNVERCEDRKI